MSSYFKTAELDGKRIAYTQETEFKIQIGKGRGAYKTHCTIIGDLAHAVAWYNGFNIGNGYKKRLLAPSMNKPVLAVYRS